MSSRGACDDCGESSCSCRSGHRKHKSSGKCPKCRHRDCQCDDLRQRIRDNIIIVLREPCVKQEICSIVSGCANPELMTARIYQTIDEYAAQSVIAGIMKYRPDGKINIPLPQPTTSAVTASLPAMMKKMSLVPEKKANMKSELVTHSKRALDCPGCSGGGCDDFTRRVKEIIEAYGFCLLEDQIMQAINDFDITSKVMTVITNNAQNIVTILSPYLNTLIKQQVLTLITTDVDVINALNILIQANQLTPAQVLQIVTGAVDTAGPLNTALIDLILATAGGGVDPAQVISIINGELVNPASGLYADIVAIINAHQSCCPVDPAQVQTIVNNLLADNTSSTYTAIVSIIQANPVCCPLDVPAVIAVINQQYSSPEFTNAVLNIVNASGTTIMNIINTFLGDPASPIYQTILDIIQGNPNPIDPAIIQAIIENSVGTSGNPLRDLIIALILANQQCCPIDPAELTTILEGFLEDPLNPIYQLILAIAAQVPVDAAQVQAIILTQLIDVTSDIYQAVLAIASSVPVDPSQVEGIINNLLADQSSTFYQTLLQIIQDNPPSCDNVVIIPAVLQQIVDLVIAQITANNCPNMITVNSSIPTVVPTSVLGSPLAIPTSTINSQFSDLGTGFIAGIDLSTLSVPSVAMYQVKASLLVSGTQPFPATHVNVDLIATYSEPPITNLFSTRAVYDTDGNIRGMINLDFTIPMIANSTIAFTLASNLATVTVEQYSISVRPVVNL